MVTNDRLETSRSRIASYIVSVTTADRADRLWPGHYTIFGTNPLGFAYGASGTALFLHRILGDLPANARNWLMTRSVTPKDYPPGLLVGTAGIAYAFSEIGMLDRAIEIMASCYRSPLLLEDATLFHGAAGWGAVSLYLFRRTGSQVYLDRVAQAVDCIQRHAIRSEGSAQWKATFDDSVHLGYGFGASGIALFLLNAGRVLGQPEAISLGRDALAFDAMHGIENDFGWTISDYPQGNLALPYWMHGNAGVGCVALRFFERLGDTHYLTLAERIAAGAYCRWSVLPSVLEGLSGVGQFMLDMYRVTGRHIYLDRARTMAETVLWYEIERPAGVAFPGRWFTRISTDYGTGSAGIGLFFDRLLRQSDWELVDFAEGSPWHTSPVVPIPELADAGSKDLT
jgi:lantibiotic modifying enzyme